jgi:hypothetical protein
MKTRIDARYEGIHVVDSNSPSSQDGVIVERLARASVAESRSTSWRARFSRHCPGLTISAAEGDGMMSKNDLMQGKGKRTIRSLLLIALLTLGSTFSFSRGPNPETIEASAFGTGTQLAL